MVIAGKDAVQRGHCVIFRRVAKQMDRFCLCLVRESASPSR